MKQPSEQRKFSRISVDVDAEFISMESGTVADRVSNIGLNGMFMQCDTELPVGTVGDLTLFIGGRESGLNLKVHGVVARSDQGGMGIQISAIDVDGLEHLRHLILYNSNDSEKMEKEFDSHLGIK